MREPISAGAFDIDGTLYPSRQLNVRVVFYVLRNLKFFLNFSAVRKILHKTAPLPDFFGYQAVLLGERMRIPREKAESMIREKAYDGLKPYFLRVKPYAHVLETCQAFKDAGLKLGILSDFPPEQKGGIWGIAALCDVVLGSEECGALKPSKYPFGLLAAKLELPFERILYVGNSLSSDIRGAKNAGMKTAYIMPLWRRLLRKKPPEADISFTGYRQLQDFVLK